MYYFCWWHQNVWCAPKHELLQSLKKIWNALTGGQTPRAYTCNSMQWNVRCYIQNCCGFTQYDLLAVRFLPAPWSHDWYLSWYSSVLLLSFDSFVIFRNFVLIDVAVLTLPLWRLFVLLLSFYCWVGIVTVHVFISAIIFVTHHVIISQRR